MGLRVRGMLTDFLYHSTLGLRVIKKKKKVRGMHLEVPRVLANVHLPSGKRLRVPRSSVRDPLIIDRDPLKRGRDPLIRGRYRRGGADNLSMLVVAAVVAREPPLYLPVHLCMRGAGFSV